MTPQEHFDEAERLLGQALNENTERAQAHAALALAGFTRDAEHYAEAERLLGQALDENTERAQVHATLALAGFTRDAASGHRHIFEGASYCAGDTPDGYGVYTNRYDSGPGVPL